MKLEKLLMWFRQNFFAGLAIVLPTVISIGFFLWIFGTIANFTDTLLFFLPYSWTHKENGEVLWYWSIIALIFGIFLTCLVGHLARYYIGKKIIHFADKIMLNVPLLNKIYSTIKQINEAFTSTKKSSFKQVVMLEFPKQGIYSIGFLTSEENSSLSGKTGKKLVSVFVPTTPNPTTGFIVLVPEDTIIRLDMSVADGIKFIISLGSISPEQHANVKLQTTNNKALEEKF